VYDIVAKNPQQKSPAFEINGREVLQPNIWYTCPLGKIARVRGKITCTGTGAGTEGRFIVATIIMFRWLGLIPGGTANLVWPDDTAQWEDNAGATQNTPINVYRIFDITLSAGQTIVTDQNAGTNAEFNLFAEVVESPV